MFPSRYAASSPQSGRESTYRPVQFCPATSEAREGGAIFIGGLMAFLIWFSWYTGRIG
jgi:hypothetical protein